MNRLKLLLSVVLFNCSFLVAQERYVGASLYGELGNQMGMISAALALAWDLGATPVFPDLNIQEANIPTNYREIFFRLSSASPLNIKWKNIALTYMYTPIEPGENTWLSPWGFDLRYFNRYRKELVEVFKPREDQISHIMSKYPEIFEGKLETVGIHIRLDRSNTIPFCGFEYFREAVELFSDDVLLVVGSNRIEWVKKHAIELFGENKNVLFLEENCHTTDFNILRMCKHNITSASTFSFWVGYLNTNESKKVIAPSLWYTHDSDYTKMGCPGNCKGNLYPDDWIILEVPLKRIVPNDLSDFTSTSVNS